MKALLLTHLFPSPSHPTRGVFNASVFRAISHHCDARVVVPEPMWDHRQGTSPAAQWTDLGLRIDRVDYLAPPRMPLARPLFMSIGMTPRLRTLRAEFPFDIIMASWAHPDAVAAARLARQFHCPFVVNVLGSDINTLAARSDLRRQITGALRQASRVIAVSGALAKNVVDLGIDPGRVDVQHNGVDGERFCIRDKRELRNRLEIDQAPPSIVYVGRLSPEKGVDILIGAAAELQATRGESFRLYIVGGGPEESELKDEVRRLGLGGIVRFVGSRPHDEIPNWVGAADVLCLPSRSEGCPNVVMEATASGVPVAASKVGGLPEIVDHRNGVLVEPESPTALADGIWQALDREWNREAIRASTPYLSWDAVGQGYVDILQAAVDEVSRPSLLRATPSPASR